MGSFFFHPLSSLSGNGKENAPSGRKPHPVPKKPVNEHEQKIIKELTGRYDEIEVLWKQAEEDLKQFRVPHTVSLHLHTDDECFPVYEYTLQWRRYGKAWRICYCVTTGYLGVDDRPDEEEVTPIIDCPHDQRLRLTHQFGDLRKKVIEEAQNTIQELDGTIANFRNLLNG